MSREVNLSEIEDALTIHELLVSAKDMLHEVFLWRLIAGEEHLGLVKIESINISRKEIILSFDERNSEKIESLVSFQSYIDFYIPSQHLLFRSHLKSFSHNSRRVVFSFPLSMSQIDRRVRKRFKYFAESDLKASFKVVGLNGQSQSFSKTCFDISGGGVSFFVSKMEKKFFQEGMKLMDLTLNNEKVQFQINKSKAQIKEIEPNEFNKHPYKLWRVSCKFEDVDQITLKLIDKFIFERIKEDLHAING